MELIPIYDDNDQVSDPVSEEEEEAAARSLPLSLGRSTVACWWWQHCPCRTSRRRNQRRRRRPCQSCRTVGRHVTSLSKSLLEINQEGVLTVNPHSKNSHLVQCTNRLGCPRAFSCVEKSISIQLQPDNMLLFGRPGEAPWMKFRVRQGTQGGGGRATLVTRPRPSKNMAVSATVVTPNLKPPPLPKRKRHRTIEEDKEEEMTLDKSLPFRGRAKRKLPLETLEIPTNQSSSSPQTKRRRPVVPETPPSTQPSLSQQQPPPPNNQDVPQSPSGRSAAARVDKTREAPNANANELSDESSILALPQCPSSSYSLSESQERLSKQSYQPQEDGCIVEEDAPAHDTRKGRKLSSPLLHSWLTPPEAAAVVPPPRSVPVSSLSLEDWRHMAATTNDDDNDSSCPPKGQVRRALARVIVTMRRRQQPSQPTNTDGGGANDWLPTLLKATETDFPSREKPQN